MKLEDVLTFGEAAKIYNLSDGSVLRNDVKRARYGLLKRARWREFMVIELSILRVN